MCRSCYEEAGKPFVDNEDVRRTVMLIADLYEFAATGGCMHIVVDDNNIDDDDIKWCLENAYEYSGVSDDPSICVNASNAVEHAIELSVGLHMLSLSEDERWSALAIFNKWDISG